MRNLVITRLVRLVLTLIAVSFMTFVMLKLLPGDEINSLIPPEAPRDPATVQALRDRLGLDDPVIVQYGRWLGNAVTGDLGTSAFGGLSVSGQIKDRVAVTAELAIVAVVFAVIISVPIGVIQAYRPGSKVDALFSGVNQVFLSTPNYLVAAIFAYIFSIKLGLLPNVGWVRISESPWGNFKSVAMPALSLALLEIAIYSRLIKNDMMTTLQENYVLSARAKGLPDKFILFRHALRPSSLSLITIIGLNLGTLLGGSVVIEFIFGLPGIGNKLLRSIFDRDAIMVQGLTVFIASSYVLINTAIDFVYLAVDPRTRAKVE